MSDVSLDILGIDTKIRDNFRLEITKIDIYKTRLSDLEESLSIPNLNSRLYNTILHAKKELSIYIDDIEGQISYNFYIIKTIPLIEEYRKLLTIPLKTSFMGRPQKKNPKKDEIIKQYLDIASTYIDIDIDYKTEFSTITCPTCGNKKDFDIVDYITYTCNKCYTQQTIMKHVSSYNDIDRINISSKYMYDRKVHFRDCIKQYQGKQNSTIPDKVYRELRDQLKLHHLINENEEDDINKFSKVTKNHILLFLKELDYSTHYENVHLIHYTFTGIRPDDISYLEEKLLDDFDALTDLYDKKFKHITRKNFINTQYVLYQLLQRHKHKCKKEEFIILKTIDRKFFHDEVCKTLFEELGWNHVPYY
jgi:hypothetical protein